VNTGARTPRGGGSEPWSGPPGTLGVGGPLRNKVGEDLALDGVVGLEVELKSRELCSPLGDVAGGIGIVEDGPQRVRGHHNNLMDLKIMAELPGCNEYSIKELMRLGISGLCPMQDLADIVDRHLDGLDFASETGSFSLSWGLAGPQVFWFFPGPGPDRTPESRVGCHFAGGRTSTSYRGGPRRPPVGDAQTSQRPAPC
jgi:hypothetical protein